MRAVLIALVVSFSAVLAAEPGPSARSAVLPNAFFAMDTATKDEQHQSIEAQVRLVKELGFDGYGPAYAKDMPAMLKVLDEVQLPLSAVYVPVTFDAAGPKYDPDFVRQIDLLRGRKTLIWAIIRSEKRAAHSAETDAAAVAVIRELASRADKVGLRVAIYPHTGDFIASTHDALKFIDAVDRSNVGLSFNLCHWLHVDGNHDLESLLKKAMPHLFVISINGSDREDPDFKDWSRLIQPLGQGDFDVYALMKTLRKLGFDGPVGLQGYGIKGSVREHLIQAVKTWRSYAARMQAERSQK